MFREFRVISNQSCHPLSTPLVPRLHSHPHLVVEGGQVQSRLILWGVQQARARPSLPGRASAEVRPGYTNELIRILIEQGSVVGANLDVLDLLAGSMLFLP